MHTECLLQRGSRWVELAEAGESSLNFAIRFGRKLFESGELARLSADDASVNVMVDVVARQLEGFGRP